MTHRCWDCTHQPFFSLRKRTVMEGSKLLSLPFIPSIAETLEFCITTEYPFRHA